MCSWRWLLCSQSFGSMSNEIGGGNQNKDGSQSNWFYGINEGTT